jgi:cytochrome b561/polyisoprenoid-binding protein YceI
MHPIRYSRMAIFLHWAIALGLAFQIALGWRFEYEKPGGELFWLYQLHKSVGISILLLSLLRLAIRLMVERPSPEADSIWARRLSGAVHSGLYVVMIGGPLTGWLLVSTAKLRVPTLLFGMVPWPHLPFVAGLEGAARQNLHEIGENAHGIIAWIGIGLFALHVAGALRHQWLLRQPLMERMLPFATRRSRVLPSLVAVTLLIAAAWTVACVIHAPAVKPPLAAVATPVSQPVEQAAPVAVPEAAVAIEENVTAAQIEPIAVRHWTVAPGGRLGFTAQWNNSPVIGSFSSWKADIAFDPAALDRSSIGVTIDLASAVSGDSQRDEALKGSEFFDTPTHPTARYETKSIKALGGDRYRANGTLTLKGVSKPLRLDFTVPIRDRKAIVKGHASLDRTLFGVGTGQWAGTGAIAADVAIDFAFTARAKD